MSKELPFSRKPSQSGGKDNWVDAKEPMKRMTLDIPETLHQKTKVGCSLKKTTITDVVRKHLTELFGHVEI